MLHSSVGMTLGGGSESGLAGRERVVVLSEAQLQGLVREAVRNEIATDQSYTKDRRTQKIKVPRAHQ